MCTDSPTSHSSTNRAPYSQLASQMLMANAERRRHDRHVSFFQPRTPLELVGFSGSCWQLLEAACDRCALYCIGTYCMYMPMSNRWPHCSGSCSLNAVLSVYVIGDWHTIAPVASGELRGKGVGGVGIRTIYLDKLSNNIY